MCLCSCILEKNTMDPLNGSGILVHTIVCSLAWLFNFLLRGRGLTGCRSVFHIY
uniref:Uncharacterized protein n=1 Tax=Anguilla anguilla TaxID=7936 RepID=A0A0E9XNQ8_ANGAN